MSRRKPASPLRWRREVMRTLRRTTMSLRNWRLYAIRRNVPNVMMFVFKEQGAARFIEIAITKSHWQRWPQEQHSMIRMEFQRAALRSDFYVEGITQ